MKKVIIGLAIAFVATVSQASYLVWQVASDEVTGFDNVVDWLTSQGETVSTVAARVVAVNNTTGDSQRSETVGFANKDPSGVWYTGPFNSVDLSTLGGSGYSYYVEIVKTSASSTYKASDVYGYSSRVAYADLPADAICESLEDVPTVSAQWHGGGTYAAAPEPTSAMLMLLGVAGLALRRKQRKA